MLRRRRFAGAEVGSRFSQIVFKTPCERVRASEHAPHDRFRVLVYRHGLAKVVERGAVVHAKRRGVIQPHRERDFVTRSENAQYHGNFFQKQRLAFFKALLIKKGPGASEGFSEEALVAVYLTAGRGPIPRRGDWLPGTAWDMSDLAPLCVAERCEPAPEDATFTHVCG